MPSHPHPTRLPSPGDAEIAAALALAAEARLVGRPHTARTSFGEAFDALHARISVLGNAIRYLAEDDLARTDARTRRADYVLLTPDEINTVWREAIEAEEAIALQGFVEPNSLLGLTERGGGGFGALEAKVAIYDLVERFDVETGADARAELEARLCHQVKRLAMLTQRGPVAMRLGDHYDLTRLGAIHDEVTTIWAQRKAAGRPIDEARWTSGHDDDLGAGGSAFAYRALAKAIADLEAGHRTGHAWAATTIRAALGAARAARR